jgi:glycerophosphoryl diester phosphodiesterase
MANETIGYKPEIIKPTTPAEMVKARKPEKYKEIDENVFLLNPTDQIISSATPEAFEKFVNIMASRGLNGLSLSASL